jgi:hypothetical protein
MEKSPMLSLISSQKIVFQQKSLDWQCCLKRRPSESNIFLVILLISTWGRIVEIQRDYTNEIFMRSLNNNAILNPNKEDWYTWYIC